MIKKEIWRKIPDKKYADSYKVSSHGRVKSVDRTIHIKSFKRKFKRVLKGKDLTVREQKRSGHMYIDLRNMQDNGLIEKKTFYIHKVVAECFLKNPDNLPLVLHIDGDKKNNNRSNLKWCTQEELTTHKKRIKNERKKKKEKNKKDTILG